MSYVDSNLMSGESVIYKAKIHWFVFLPGTILTSIGLLLIAGSKQGDGSNVFAAIFLLFGFVSLFKAFIERISTELAVTSKRIIAKQGLIRRNTIELNHSKVESFHIDQGIIGRIFDFGTIVINGTGGGKSPIPNIDSPMNFRRNAMETIDTNQRI